MASPRKKMYDGPNPVDEYLLNQVVKHVNPEELDSMARDLVVDESVYQGIQNPKNRVYKVIQLSFPLIYPSFVKLTQLAQFDKTSHAW